MCSEAVHLIKIQFKPNQPTLLQNSQNNPSNQTLMEEQPCNIMQCSNNRINSSNILELPCPNSVLLTHLLQIWIKDTNKTIILEVEQLQVDGHFILRFQPRWEWEWIWPFSRFTYWVPLPLWDPSTSLPPFSTCVLRAWPWWKCRYLYGHGWLPPIYCSR